MQQGPRPLEPRIVATNTTNSKMIDDLGAATNSYTMPLDD